MSCKALKLKGCEIKGSTFQGRKFTFPNRDISSHVFTLKIPKLNIEKQGVVNQNDVYFSYSDFEGFKEGLYAVEFWANFEGIGIELIAEETFVISLTSCGGGSSSNNTTFNLEFPEETIDYSVEYAVINIYETGGTVTWENVTGKPTVFYNDTEIKEEIAEKVDKVEGYGLSQNNYTTADKTKLDNINLSNYVLQTSLNSQLASYVLQSTLNTQLQSYATLNGVQTFNSTITFAQAPIVPNGTLNGHAVNLGQLNANFLSYTGATKPININSQSFVTSGTIMRNAASFIQNNLSDSLTIGTHYRKFENIASFSKGGGNITNGVLFVKFPQTDMGSTATTWNMVLDIFMNIGEKITLSIRGYFDHGSFYSGVSVVEQNCRDHISSVKLGNIIGSTLRDGVVVITFKQAVGDYLKANIVSFQTMIGYTPRLDSKSNYSINFLDEVSLPSNITFYRTFLQLDFTRDPFLVSSTQVKTSANTTLIPTNNKTTIIITANRTVTVPSTLPDDYEVTFIADGGTITFANSGTTFKFNNSKVLLASGGIATLRKENGTNNFYLKGDLT